MIAYTCPLSACPGNPLQYFGVLTSSVFYLMLIVSVFNFLKSPGSDLKEKEEALLPTSHLTHPNHFLSSYSLISHSSPLKSDLHHCPPMTPPAWVGGEPPYQGRALYRNIPETRNTQKLTGEISQPSVYLHRGREKQIVDYLKSMCICLCNDTILLLAIKPLNKTFSSQEMFCLGQ